MAQTKTAAATKSATKSPRKKAAPKAAAKKPAKPAKPAAKKPAAKTPAKAAKKPAAGKAKPASKAGDEQVTLDRRRDAERRNEEAAVATAAPATPAPKLERREKVNRRRQIDPTTCERDYSDSEVEFMNALDAYKRRSGRMFPTCSEVLEVIHEMGYVQLSPTELATIKSTRGDVAEELEDAAESEANEALAESESLHID